MSWTNKYWDILNHFYWWPPYIGMRSISQKKWTKNDGKICVPAELVNMSGPLYSRERKFEDLENHLLGNEEILNHIFDLTFSIAPDTVINESFLKPLGFDDKGEFESIGGRQATAIIGKEMSLNKTDFTLAMTAPLQLSLS